MIVKTVRSKGLALLSYLVGSHGEAVVVDPRRDCQVYIDLVQREEMRIIYIFETHRNEDYVTGSTQLAYLTGAEIYHGPGLGFGYGHTLNDGQEFLFGALKLTAIHTPGHTDESMSYMLVDLTTGKEPAIVFTGDTLFVGDVGRTDLYGREEAQRLAGNLYDSIFKRLLPLGDSVIVRPSHGAGSVCGKSISAREESTLGLERAQNPALQMRDREEFIQFKVNERLERPPYFNRMEQLNLLGPPLMKHIPKPRPLSPGEFEEASSSRGVAVDTRSPPAFAAAHVKGSYNIWLEGLPSFAGWVLPYDQPLLLILEDEERLMKAVRYLLRLGYDRVAGYLQGGIESWYTHSLPIEQLGLMTAQELNGRLDRGESIRLIDVRGREEWESGHIEQATNIHVGRLKDELGVVPSDELVVVTCSVGNRASLAASILRRGGHERVYNLIGGMTAWRNADYAIAG